MLSNRAWISFWTGKKIYIIFLSYFSLQEFGDPGHFVTQSTLNPHTSKSLQGKLGWEVETGSFSIMAEEEIRIF